MCICRVERISRGFVADGAGAADVRYFFRCQDTGAYAAKYPAFLVVQHVISPFVHVRCSALLVDRRRARTHASGARIGRGVMTRCDRCATGHFLQFVNGEISECFLGESELLRFLIHWGSSWII